MSFQPYYSNAICENITTEEIDNMYRQIMAYQRNELNFGINDYNTQIQIDPNFKRSHCATVMRKSLLYRRRELDKLDLEAPQQSLDPVSAVVGFIGSMMVGAFVGDKIASFLRLGADMDEVNKLYRK